MRGALRAGLALAAFACGSAAAHDARPAYLEIKEAPPGRSALVWRTPDLGGARSTVELQLPAGVRTLEAAVVSENGGVHVERRVIDLGAEGLEGRRIAFPGLEVAGIDVVVHVVHANGTEITEVVHPSRPWIDLAPSRGRWALAGAFLLQGVRHILTGADHLLFVFGLVFLVGTPWKLAKTITGFTLAHSLTLAVATFTGVRIPAPPLEAAIALSILFLGPEIIRAHRGETSFTIRNPWVVAFAFGLLHGFGFASGLTVMGLPRADIPLALLAFNGGVEIGQLAFVSVVLLARWSLRRTSIDWPRPLRALPAYAVGSLGAFWMIERVATMLRSR